MTINRGLRGAFCIFCVVLLLFMMAALAIPVKAAAPVMPVDFLGVAQSMLESAGIHFDYTGMNSQSVADGLYSLLEKCVSAISPGDTVEDWLGAYELTMVGQYLHVPPATALKAWAFARWLVGEYGLESNGDAILVSNEETNTFIDADGVVYPVSIVDDNNIIISFGGAFYDYAMSATPKNIILSSDGSAYINVDSASLVAAGTVDGGHRWNSRMVSGDYYFFYIRGGNLRVGSNESGNTYFSVAGAGWPLDSLNFETDVSSIALEPGDITIPDTIGNDETVVIGSDVINPGMTLEEAVNAILEASAANTLTVTQAITQAGAIDEPINLDLGEVDDYKVVGLADVFPFCIPFDVVRFLQVLDAKREAPHFQIPFQIPSLGIDYTFEIDLTMFESVAAIIRTMELLLFVVGLAVATRSMFIRG